MSVLEGSAAFVNLSEHEEYNGQSTGKYALTLSLEEDVVDELKNKGVKVKDYEGTGQRKFVSKYDIPVFDGEGNPFTGHITRGSKLRIAYTLGNPHPVHGVATYLNKVKVLSLADIDMGDF